MKSLTSRALGILLAISLVPACATQSADDPDNQTSEVSQGITTDDILARAREWVADRVPYCGGPNGGADLICGGTCRRPSAAWNSFRSDCSGYVSWSWQIPDDPATATYKNDRGGANGWTTVSLDALQPGDAFVTDGHIKLFSNLVGAGAADILEEFDCGQVAREVTQSFTRNGNTLRFNNGDLRVYHAIRRNGVSGSSRGGGSSPSITALSGDGYGVAFQSDGGELWIVDSSGGGQGRGLGLMPSTSPSIAALPGDEVEVAFQSDRGQLWIVDSGGGGGNWGLGMMAGTNPSITAMPEGGYQAAFQSDQGELWIVDSSGGGGSWGLGMMPGTSPSITALVGGGYEAAFQSNRGELWTVDSNGGGGGLGLGMMAGTSPSITALAGGGYQVAFQANTGSLWTIGTGGTSDWQAGLMHNTSPSITGLADGGFAVTFQSDRGQLWTADWTGAGVNWGLGMMPGTNPSIAGLTGGGFEVTFQSDRGQLWIIDGGEGGGNWGLGMMHN